MQIIYKDKNKWYISRKTDAVGVVICAERIGRYLEIKHYLKSGSLSYAIVREFLSDLKEESSKGDDKTMKVAKLK